MNPRPTLYSCKDCSNKITDINQKGGVVRKICKDCRHKHQVQHNRDAYYKRKLDSIKYYKYRLYQRRTYLRSAIPKLEEKITLFQKEIIFIDNYLKNNKQTQPLIIMEKV